MNDARRKEIDKAIALLNQAHNIIENAANDEREYYDNMPENMQQGERGSNADATADALSEAESELQDIIANIESAME